MNKQHAQMSPAFQQGLMTLTTDLFQGARATLDRFRSGGRRAALLQQKETTAPPPPPPKVEVKAAAKTSHDVEEDTNPLKTGIAYFHPHAQLDGDTHINIDTRAKTPLGRQLTHLHHTDFVHPVMGPFASMEGFWGFIRNGGKGDNFRKLHGMTARRESKKVNSRRIDNFYEIMVEANYHRIDQNPELRKLMVESTLPFEHYYVHGTRGTPPGKASNPGLLIRPPVGEFMVKMMTEVRELLKAGVEPKRPSYQDVEPRTPNRSPS